MPTSLNPVYTVGDQIAESVRLHEGLSKRESLNRAIEMLKLIDMPPGKIVAGQVLWQGRDLVPLPPAEMQKIQIGRASCRERV